MTRWIAAGCLLALALVGVRDAGLTTRSLEVSAEFADAAGLAPNAEVAYRGVRIGRVASLHPLPDGVRAELVLDRAVRVPASTRAIVTTRPAVGGRYLDLRPDTAAGPYLRGGATIGRDRTGGPVPLERLLLNLSALAASVDADDLRVVIDELARALDGNGPALATLLDSQRTLLTDAEQTLPQTVRLLRESRTVLAGAATSADALHSWSGALTAVSAELRTGKLLTAGTRAAAETAELLRGLAPSTGFLLGNLVVLGQVQGRRLDGLQQILVSYPQVLAQGRRIAPGDGTAHLGLVLEEADPPPCRYSQGRSNCRPVRGAQNAPRPGGPEPPGDPHPAAAPDGAPLLLGATGGQASVLGASSWKALLLGPLAG